MRILIVGHFKYDMHYGVMQKLHHAYIRAGHVVYHFDDRNVARASTWFNSSKFGKPFLNKKFLEACRKFEPDFILLGHCELIENSSLETIRKEFPNIKIAYRNVDWLEEAHKVTVIQKRTTVVDRIFITTAGDALKQFSGNCARISYIPNPVDNAIDTGRAFADNTQDFDLFYAIGGVYEGDPRPGFVERMKQQCPTARFKLHGFKAGTNLNGAAFMRGLVQAKMGLSYSRKNDIYLYSSDRMAQYMGNGLLTFVDRATGFTELFAEDEVGFYSDEKELTEKINQYLADDALRQQHAENGWHAVHERFSSDLVAAYMLEQVFEQKAKRGYAWPVEVY